jgi:hypothetical protein
MRDESREAPWPRLSGAELHDTARTMHRWLQVLGKIRLALAPHVNHWWQATVYVTPRGLTTSSVPFGSRSFALELDLSAHRLRALCSDGGEQSFALTGAPVADFTRRTFAALGELGITVDIWPVPVEVEDRTPLDADERPRVYRPEQAHALWSALVAMEPVFQRFRSRYLGKVSPVHVFWGAFDLAVTRFSGRTAPAHPGAPNLARWVAREAYSHEVSSCGFWCGDPVPGEPAFYAYCYPEPPGFAEYAVEPAAAHYDPVLHELILPYEAVRASADPAATLLRFLQTSYEAGAVLGGWDRQALERPGDAVSRR